MKCLGTCSGSCDPTNMTVCQTCVEGFTLESNGCVKCPTGCSSCTGDQCSSCMANYELKMVDGKIKCKEECFYGCDECDNSTTCNQCSSAMVPDGNTRCVPDLSFGSTYGFCPPGTYKDANSACVECPSITCKACTASGCTACMDGHYVDGGGCPSCVSPCVKCKDAQTCTKCDSGYFLPVISVTNNQKTYGSSCKACSNRCVTCEDNNRTCTSCNGEHHRLIGTKCIGRFTTVFVIVLDITYSNFLTQALLLTFIESMNSFLLVDVDNIVINSISEGSTRVEGSISAENAQ